MQRQLRHCILLIIAGLAAGCSTPRQRIAGVVTAYYTRCHADVIVSRILKTETLDGKGRQYPLELVSLYTDQVHERDISRELAAKYEFPIYPTIAETLTLGTGELAVDGVLLVAEHGTYEKSPTGNTQYPKRRMFEEIVKVFEQSGRVVPVYVDKHLADNWEDAKWIYDTAQRLKIPLMAGSSLPVAWRRPAADIDQKARLEEIVAVSYHTLDSYGFHALEYVQCLAEKRLGGNAGIVAVQCLSEDEVWKALDDGRVDAKLFEMAYELLPRKLNRKRTIREAARSPSLFILEYADGLKAYIFTLNRVAGAWTSAWRYADGRREGSYFELQKPPPYMHFGLLMAGIEKMLLTGQPTWPAERTLMTSGALDALLISKSEGGKRRETPYLNFAYDCDWRWRQPPEPPVVELPKPPRQKAKAPNRK